MNNGTKIRTVAFAVACVNQAISSIGAVDLGNETANLVYRVFSLACTIVSGSFALYYNNDFTIEGEIGTKITREMKELRDHIPMTAEEPEDAHIEESEAEDGEE